MDVSLLKSQDRTLLEALVREYSLASILEELSDIASELAQEETEKGSQTGAKELGKYSEAIRGLLKNRRS